MLHKRIWIFWGQWIVVTGNTFSNILCVFPLHKIFILCGLRKNIDKYVEINIMKEVISIDKYGEIKWWIRCRDKYVDINAKLEFKKVFSVLLGCLCNLNTFK